MYFLGRLLIRYLELVLTAVGLGICLALISGLPPSADKWQVIAITAMVIGVTHGIIFFAVRVRLRAMRHQAIQDVAYMLQERVSSYIYIVSRLSESDNSGHQQMARQAARDLADLVNTLSEETLTSWKSRHHSRQLQALQQNMPVTPPLDR